MLASHVASFATPGDITSDEQQAFLRMVVGAVALDGDGEPLGIFSGDATPWDAEGMTSEQVWACPFQNCIPWSFLVGLDE
jgi:hypothetical protein